MASIGVASQPPSRRTEEPRERRMAEPREISRMEVERLAPRSDSTRREGTGVTGPSFLGLSDASEDYDEPGYSRPYGDDLYRSNWGARFLFALIVIGVVGGLGYMQLKSSHPLQAILGTQQATNSNGQQQNGSAPQPNADGQPSTHDNQNAASSGNAAAASANSGSSTQAPGTATSGNNDDASAQNAAGAKGAAPSSTDDLKDKRTNSTTAAKDKTASADEKTDSSAGDKQASDANNKQSSDTSNKQASSSSDEQASASAVSGKKTQSANGKSKSAKAKSSSDDEIAANTDDSSANDSSSDDRDTRSAAAAPARAIDNSEEPVRQAEIYLEGKGVPQNCDEGLGILHAAEQRGNSRALVKLGAIYATGNCVPKDNAIAYHYFTRAHAVDPKNEWVEENRAILWANMTADERNRARAEDGGVQ